MRIDILQIDINPDREYCVFDILGIFFFPFFSTITQDSQRSRQNLPVMHAFST